ncbi:MAG: hypothetical protein SVM86_07650 [Candidatus Cloacimonadota bacterium]|nr:hypothetical protein [Candidatus Cloacimonadota bacterium]
MAGKEIVLSTDNDITARYNYERKLKQKNLRLKNLKDRLQKDVDKKIKEYEKKIIC